MRVNRPLGFQAKTLIFVRDFFSRFSRPLDFTKDFQTKHIHWLDGYEFTVGLAKCPTWGNDLAWLILWGLGWNHQVNIAGKHCFFRWVGFSGGLQVMLFLSTMSFTTSALKLQKTLKQTPFFDMIHFCCSLFCVFVPIQSNHGISKFCRSIPCRTRRDFNRVESQVINTYIDKINILDRLRSQTRKVDDIYWMTSEFPWSTQKVLAEMTPKICYATCNGLFIGITHPLI